MHAIPQSFAFLGEGNLLGVPFVLWVAGGVRARDARGSGAHAAGPLCVCYRQQPGAAVYAGVPVAFDTTAIYALGGLLTGLAGMIEASRLMTGQPIARATATNCRRSPR